MRSQNYNFGYLGINRLIANNSESVVNLKYVPGCPNLFLNKAEESGLKIYILEVDSQAELTQVKDLPIDGIVMNRS